MYVYIYIYIIYIYIGATGVTRSAGGLKSRSAASARVRTPAEVYFLTKTLLFPLILKGVQMVKNVIISTYSATFATL